MAGINSTQVSYAFGQMGSVYQDTTAATTPPVGKVFVAITMLGGKRPAFDVLVAQTKLKVDGTVSGDEYGNTLTDEGFECIGTAVAAHNASAGSETTITGAGGVVMDSSNGVPKGLTIYGRWTSFTLAADTHVIAYLGDAE